MADITPAVLVPLPRPAAPQPPCAAPGCPAPIVVQWQRRPTHAEYQDVLTAEQIRRATITARADPQQPPPAFGPPPAIGECTRPVYACADHAISIDLAARVHASNCTIGPGQHPGCSCTPEPLPAPKMGPPAHATLATGWAIPTT